MFTNQELAIIGIIVLCGIAFILISWFIRLIFDYISNDKDWVDPTHEKRKDD